MMTDIKTGCSYRDNLIAEWFRMDRNENSRAELKALLEQKKYDEVSNLLGKRLAFGTAGLRGRMGTGTAQLNDLVIIQTAQGFLKYLIKTNGTLLKNVGLVIGYDGRHNSKRWAELTATIFISAGYPVLLFEDMVPTPFVPFTVMQFGCVSGVMVTASHNPKEDNGYKVYGPNGAQINTPVDEDIQNSILENLEPLESSWNTGILADNPLRKNPSCEIIYRYLNYIDQAILPESKELNKKVNMLFTYTALHGVGYKYVQQVCDKINARIFAVPEQRDPHPDFPTVKFPNPEEGKSCLELSMKYADANDSKLIMATDPDADRFAMAEKLTDGWKIYTGNQLGAMFAWWMLHSFRQSKSTVPINKVYMIYSTVSSMICKSMAKVEGFNTIDVLTGYKWLANKAYDLEKKGNKVILCFEEAIGYMCSTEVLDKDGVSACAQMCSCASYIYNQSKTMNKLLDEIFDKYGLHITNNSYYVCKDAEVIKKIFERIRNIRGPNTYPQSILNGKYKIKNVRDVTTGFDDNQPDKKAILPVSPSAEMITFYFENGLVCTLRTSGTEPKIKYYTEICASPDNKDKEAVNSTLQEMSKAICEEMLEPSKNNIIHQSDIKK
ncbi:unnamed protein product [Psylliodes chrysocephalus]|uniref:Phosphoglucomutase-2 n=1 Tax=Psylliodes chrysocephalus TaxID=3402493 RepID=A0A9P0CH57_9CUCU|nr:unnamed protein product [Psylliodes chrysocephala]